MAVANTKSNIVTNADAGTASLTSAVIQHGRVREQAATVEVAAADDAASVYRLFRVHSSWRLSQMFIGNDAITGMSTADVGIYDIASVNSGAAIDDDLYATDVDMSNARALADVLYEATATDLVNVEKRIWEVLYAKSLITTNADPNKWYDICVTANTNEPSGAGTISGLLRYVDGT